jgi:hypothetical protein
VKGGGFLLKSWGTDYLVIYLTTGSSAAAVFWDDIFTHQQEIQAELGSRFQPVSE